MVAGKGLNFIHTAAEQEETKQDSRDFKGDEQMTMSNDGPPFGTKPKDLSCGRTECRRGAKQFHRITLSLFANFSGMC